MNNPNIFHFLVILLTTAGGFHRGTHKRLLLKDGLEPGLSGPAGSTESQPVSMINNRCLFSIEYLEKVTKAMGASFPTHRTR